MKNKQGHTWWLITFTGDDWTKFSFRFPEYFFFYWRSGEICKSDPRPLHCHSADTMTSSGNQRLIINAKSMTAKFQVEYGELCEQQEHRSVLKTNRVPPIKRRSAPNEHSGELTWTSEALIPRRSENELWARDRRGWVSVLRQTR